jgi:hypothetical protein
MRACTSETQSHPNRLGGRLRKAVPLIEAASWPVCQKVDEGAGRSHFLDVIEESAKDRVAQTAPLVFGHDGHIDDMEVPAPVAQHASHPHNFAVRLVNDMTSSPTPRQSHRGLLLGDR